MQRSVAPPSLCQQNSNQFPPFFIYPHCAENFCTIGEKDVYLAKWGLDQSSAKDDVDNSAQYTAVTICQKGPVPIIEHSRPSKWWD